MLQTERVTATKKKKKKEMLYNRDQDNDNITQKISHKILGKSERMSIGGVSLPMGAFIRFHCVLCCLLNNNTYNHIVGNLQHARNIYAKVIHTHSSAVTAHNIVASTRPMILQKIFDSVYDIPWHRANRQPRQKY